MPRVSKRKNGKAKENGGVEVAYIGPNDHYRVELMVDLGYSPGDLHRETKLDWSDLVGILVGISTRRLKEIKAITRRLDHAYSANDERQSESAD